MTTAEQISRCQYRRDKLAAVQATLSHDDLIGMSLAQWSRRYILDEKASDKK